MLAERAGSLSRLRHVLSIQLFAVVLAAALKAWSALSETLTIEQVYCSHAYETAPVSAHKITAKRLERKSMRY